jgi:hypothetical protein
MAMVWGKEGLNRRLYLLQQQIFDKQMTSSCQVFPALSDTVCVRFGQSDPNPWGGSREDIFFSPIVGVRDGVGVRNVRNPGTGTNL